MSVNFNPNAFINALTEGKLGNTITAQGIEDAWAYLDQATDADPDKAGIQTSGRLTEIRNAAVAVLEQSVDNADGSVDQGAVDALRDLFTKALADDKDFSKAVDDAKKGVGLVEDHEAQKQRQAHVEKYKAHGGGGR